MIFHFYPRTFSREVASIKKRKRSRWRRSRKRRRRKRRRKRRRRKRRWQIKEKVKSMH